MGPGCPVLGCPGRAWRVRNCYTSWVPLSFVGCPLPLQQDKLGSGEGVEGENSVHIPGGDIESFLVQGCTVAEPGVVVLVGEGAPQLAGEGWLRPPCPLFPGQPRSAIYTYTGGVCPGSLEDRVLWQESVKMEGAEERPLSCVEGKGTKRLPEAGWSTSVPSTCPPRRTLFWKGVGKEGPGPLLESESPPAMLTEGVPTILPQSPRSGEGCLWAQWR